MKKLLKSKRGEGYIDVCIIVLVVIMVLALFTAVAPVMITTLSLSLIKNYLLFLDNIDINNIT